MPTRRPNRLQSQMIFNLRQSFTNWLTPPQAHLTVRAQVYTSGTVGDGHAAPTTVDR